MLTNTTILVKTFERPESLRGILRSLSEHVPGVPVLVADDGELTAADVCEEFADVAYLTMPFDSGLSAGRNFLVERVDTEYCILLDDDFMLLDDTSLPLLVSECKAWPYDIVAGKLMLDDGRPQHFEGWMYEKDRTLWMVRISSAEQTVPMQLVLNFFAARTQVLRDVQWDNALKVCEHEDFFWRARAAGVAVGYCPRAVALHKRDHGGARYREFRNRVGEMRGMALAKHGWKKTQWLSL